MSIPTNLITGFLGVGKTTAVIDLLKRKPPGAPWAVLVNEYGDVSIDDALIAGSGPEGVTVREVAGGCVCCASAPYLPVAIHFLLVDAKPERLLIETDAPALPPQGHRGERNEPAYLPAIASRLADIHRRPVRHIAEITTANAMRLYWPRESSPAQ